MNRTKFNQALLRLTAFTVFALLLSTSAAAEFEVGALELTGSTRVSRVEFEYTYRVNITNPDALARGVTATITSTSPYTTIVDGELDFGDINAGATALSTDTFVLRQNRRAAFDVANLVFNFSFLAPLAVSIDTPAPLLTLGSSPVAVTGTVQPGNATLTVNGVPISHSGGAFSAFVTLEEGLNTIVARAVQQLEQVTASVSVSLDTTPPYLTLESHTPGQTVHADTATITGLVNDIVRGTIEADQANVTVNGQPATIVNRSYAAQDLPLVEGVNRITVLGTDQVGNLASLEFDLSYEPPIGKRIEQVSGQNQSAVIDEVVPEPLVVRVVDDDLVPVVGESVVFRVIQGSGAVAASTPEESRAVSVTTNAAGLASTPFRVGVRVGTANQKVRARVVGYDSEVVFSASTSGRIGNKLSVNSGNNQRGVAGAALPAPLVTVVTDSGANVVAGARVRYEATVGNGTFDDGTDTTEVVTDSDGRATVNFHLGHLEGIDAQRVTATLLDGPAGTSITAGFTASAFVPADPGATRISGVVLDNQDSPLPGVTVRVENSTRQAIADGQGRFVITEAPIGPVHLIADGSTATVPGEFPSLSYNLVTIAGVDNPMPAPIYMVKLNVDGAVLAGPEDVELTLDEFPGFKLEIEANSVTFPDGSNEGLVSVTPVNASKVPMAPPNGMQPQFIVTIQPTGALFDPPARLTLPNVDGFAPGAQVEMFSYDHDLEEFVAIGLGTTSEDGTVVTSNPGIGVIKAGWHCGAQPSGAGCLHNCRICERCNDSCNCVPDPNDPRLIGRDEPGDCRAPICRTEDGHGEFGEVVDILDCPLPNTKPLVILEGASPLHLELNELFVDPGARAEDLEDDDDLLSDRINVDPRYIDTSVLGAHRVGYTVTDSGGLTSDPEYRLVLVGVAAPCENNTRPELRLHGDIAVYYNRDSYPFEDREDETYTAWDAEDGDLTHKVMYNHDGQLLPNTPVTKCLNYEDVDFERDFNCYLGKRTYWVFDGCFPPLGEAKQRPFWLRLFAPEVEFPFQSRIQVHEGETYLDQPPTFEDREDGIVDPDRVSTLRTRISVRIEKYEYEAGPDSDGFVGRAVRWVFHPAPAPNQRPRIDLIGGPLVLNVLPGEYTDQGATADDPEDGVLTDRIVTNIHGDLFLPGFKIVNYSVTDSGGLTGHARRVVLLDSGDIRSVGFPPVNRLLSVDTVTNELVSIHPRLGTVSRIAQLPFEVVKPDLVTLGNSLFLLDGASSPARLHTLNPQTGHLKSTGDIRLDGESIQLATGLAQRASTAQISFQRLTRTKVDSVGALQSGGEIFDPVRDLVEFVGLGNNQPGNLTLGLVPSLNSVAVVAVAETAPPIRNLNTVSRSVNDLVAHGSFAVAIDHEQAAIHVSQPSMPVWTVPLSSSGTHYGLAYANFAHAFFEDFRPPQNYADAQTSFEVWSLRDGNEGFLLSGRAWLISDELGWVSAQATSSGPDAGSFPMVALSPTTGAEAGRRAQTFDGVLITPGEISDAIVRFTAENALFVTGLAQIIHK